MQRRVVDTARRGDGPRWEDLACRALASRRRCSGRHERPFGSASSNLAPGHRGHYRQLHRGTSPAPSPTPPPQPHCQGGWPVPRFPAPHLFPRRPSAGAAAFTAAAFSSQRSGLDRLTLVSPLQARAAAGRGPDGDQTPVGPRSTRIVWSAFRFADPGQFAPSLWGDLQCAAGRALSASDEG
jgi:hypothetical protein